jgi:hypothetical protein
MRTKWILALLPALVLPATAADNFKLTGLAPGRPKPDIITVFYSGSLPAPQSDYNLPSAWRVEWQVDEKPLPPTQMHIDSVAVDSTFKSFLLHVSGNLPSPSDKNKVVWTVLLLSESIPYTVLNYPASSTTQGSDEHFLRPVQDKETPDLSLTGGFTAAGGSNPLYQLEAKGGLMFLPNSSLHPAINLQVEINQNPSPPIHRTTFDPDSISASFALTRYQNFKKGPFVGTRFQAELPEGEFSRTDPSSNIIASGIATLDFKPWQPSHSAYVTLYPFFGMELGRNLNRPSVVEMIPVNLSNYRGIVRGFMGADAKFGVASADRKSDVFSITGTYRVRIPAYDEPFLETLHQVTTFAMTTKARHWIEADLSYTIPSWKYLAISAMYQYGELPPFFEFVHHKFTFGLKLQASQGTKATGTKLVQ